MFGSWDKESHQCTEKKVTLKYLHMQLRVKAGKQSPDKGHMWDQVGPNEPGINALCLGSELEPVLSRREE